MAGTTSIFSNDRTENFLFHNKHDGTFEEIGSETNTAYGQNGESTSSMGPVFADLEGTGWLDLWVTDGRYNRLLHNTGKMSFEDLGVENGVSQANAQYASWGTGIYDFDNNGQLDILIFHGGLVHLIPQEHTLLRGLGNGKFADVSREAGPVLSVRTTARGACFADYENNGKVDAFVVNLGSKGTLLHNVSTNTGHWIAIKLKGTKSNRDGIGARIEVIARGKRQMAERVAGSGYLSQNDERLHFGLGAAKTVDKLIVHWPRDYASPLEILLSADGARLYVLCQQSEEVRVLDASSYTVIKNIAVGRVPRGMSFSPDGARLFVTNSWDDTLSVIDTSALAVVAAWPVGMEPSSVVSDRHGTRLFVANRISNDVAVLNAQTGVEEKRLLAGRGSSYLALSPDGSRVYATHVYPNPSPLRTGLENRTAPESEITVIDAARAVVVDRMPLHRIAGVFHVALSADGRLGVVAEYHPKNLVPLAHLEHGGAFEDTITVFGADVGKTVEVPLDELERYASQPFGVAIAPDKSRIYVTSGGSEIVTVVDVPHLMRFIHMHPAPFVQDLSASANYVVTRIPVGHNPRGLTLTRRLVALDDTACFAWPPSCWAR
jgi:YVTN family beta-propeller protein